MADVDQITYSHSELIEILLKESKIHEGQWALLVNLGMNVGGFVGPNEEVSPGALLLVHKIGLQRHLGPVQKGAVIVDAAKVNPKAKGGS